MLLLLEQLHLMKTLWWEALCFIGVFRSKRGGCDEYIEGEIAGETAITVSNRGGAAFNQGIASATKVKPNSWVSLSGHVMWGLLMMLSMN